ncbi:MAG: putative Lycopene cyclase [Polaromonas sp.]|nr:putative Lycopene cyclase [Polaromonas sp.]
MSNSSPASGDADLILVGGGLANGLLAWRLRMQRPGLRVLLLEAGNSLGGNHTWSFHDGDLNPAEQAWMAPLVTHRWTHHEVVFPQRQRLMEAGYASITSQRFDAMLRTDLGSRIRLKTPVAQVRPRAVVLADGQTLTAAAVIDGRGVQNSPHLALGYQKFLGQELRLAAPHDLRGPVLMDASVVQHDGYRFVYVLPLSADTVLVEDTFYADGSTVDPNRLRSNIAAYVQARGWTVAALLREERGALPITLDGDIDAFWTDVNGVARSGLAAGLFHPTTGYSLPDAVRLADRVAALPDVSAVPLFNAISAHARRQWRAQGFFRLLNRMLFQAAAPDQRWRVMQRFYGLPAPLIHRFYAGRPSLLDKVRILSGKPPVPLAAAARAALSKPAHSLVPESFQ